MTNQSSSNGFTGGPWRVSANGNVVRIGDATENILICKFSNPTNANRQANARLISAAPNLYEALKQAQVLLDELTHPNTSNASISSQVYFARCVEAEVAARAALSKAGSGQ